MTLRNDHRGISELRNRFQLQRRSRARTDCGAASARLLQRRESRYWVFELELLLDVLVSAGFFLCFFFRLCF